MTSHENNEAGDVRDEDAETPPPVDRLTRNAPIGGGANAQPSAFPPATMDALLDEVDTLRERLAEAENALEAGDACGAVGCRAMERLSEVIDEAADDLLVRATSAEERLAKVMALIDAEDARVAEFNSRPDRVSRMSGKPWRIVGILPTRDLRAALSTERGA